MVKKLGVAEASRRTGIPKGTIKGWKHERYKPPATKWHPEPSNELAYVLGVLYGDGSVYIDRYHYRIQLGVKDLEFAEAFSITMAKTLNKKYITQKWVNLIVHGE